MSTGQAIASIAHQSHGRTRLRFKSERGRKNFFEELASQLAELPGIVRVEARPQTGSVILYHRGFWTELAKSIMEAGLFVLAAEEEAANPLESLGLPSRLPVSLVAAGGMAALAVLQFARGDVLPKAVTLLWYAHQLTSPFFSTSNKE